MTEQDSRRAIEAVFRIESAQLIASLMRLVRDVGLATKAELRAAKSTEVIAAGFVVAAGRDRNVSPPRAQWLYR